MQNNVVTTEARQYKHFTDTFTTFDGLDLYYQQWIPSVRRPRASVIIVHGFGSHSNHYMQLVNHLFASDRSVYAFDNRGMAMSWPILTAGSSCMRTGILTHR